MEQLIDRLNNNVWRVNVNNIPNYLIEKVKEKNLKNIFGNSLESKNITINHKLNNDTKRYFIDVAKKDSIILESLELKNKENNLISITLNQLENRILYKKLLGKDIYDIKDFHVFIASKLFNKSYEEITNKERKIGKSYNFNLIYGISFEKLVHLIHGYLTEETVELTNVLLNSYEDLNNYIEKNGGIEKIRTDIKLEHYSIQKNILERLYSLESSLNFKIVMSVLDEIVIETETENLIELSKEIKDIISSDVVVPYFYVGKTMADLNKDSNQIDI